VWLLQGASRRKISLEFTDKDPPVLAINLGESKKIIKKYLDHFPRTCCIVPDIKLAAM
jgi:hypothetical protein